MKKYLNIILPVSILTVIGWLIIHFYYRNSQEMSNRSLMPGYKTAEQAKPHPITRVKEVEAEIVKEGKGPPPSKPLAEEAVKPFEESEADYQERVDAFLQQCRVIEQTRARLWTSWDTQRAPIVVYIIEKMSDSELAHLKELASSSLESYPDSLQNRLNTDREEILKQFAMQHQYKWLLVGTPNNPNEHIVVQEGEFNDMNELSENRKHPPSHLRRGKMYSLTKIDEKWRYGHLIQSTVEDQ